MTVVLQHSKLRYERWSIMGQSRWKNRWRRLDNTAKIFPVIANENVSQVFRISATLKEPVDPELLGRALEEILPEIRNFRVKLRRGLFWYYFEENDRIPQVKRENTYPCRFIDPHGNQRFLFRVTYYEKAHQSGSLSCAHGRTRCGKLFKMPDQTVSSSGRRSVGVHDPGR